MRSVFRWPVLLAALLLLALWAQPVLADAPHGGRVVMGEDFRLRADERLDGDLVSFGGRVTLEHGSQVRGNVVSLGGPIEAAGTVDGNVYALGGPVRLVGTAVVRGNVFSSEPVQQDTGAVVHGQAVSVAAGPVPVPLPLAGVGFWRDGPRWGLHGGWFGDLFVGLIRGVFGFVAMAVLSILVVLLIPGLTRTVSNTITGYPAQSVGVGLLTGVAAALVVPILIITCLGIPIAVLAVLALAVAGLFGWIAAALALGERVLAALRQAEGQPLVAVLVGALILSALANIPCLGAVIAILALAWGLGAVVLTRFGSMPYSAAAPGVTPPALPQGPESGL